jgi:hypothetical protein
VAKATLFLDKEKIMQTNNAVENVRCMKIIFNEGKPEIDGATLKVQWLFGKETAEKVPTHILAMDLKPYAILNIKSDGYAWDSYSPRKVFKIADTMGFWQFNRPGKHKILFVALRVEDCQKEDFSLKVLSCSDGGNYGNPLFVDEKNGEIAIRRVQENLPATVICCLNMEIDIPEVFFAKKPTSAIGKAFWNYSVPRERGGDPDDECEYRGYWFKRLIPKLVFHVPTRILIGLFITSLLTLVRFSAFFFGWRPCLLSGLGELWNFNSRILGIKFGKDDFRILFLEECDHDRPRCKRYMDLLERYRVWSVKENPKDESEVVLVKMPFAPWHLAVFGLIVWAFWGSSDKIGITNLLKISVFWSSLLVGWILLMVFFARLVPALLGKESKIYPKLSERMKGYWSRRRAERQKARAEAGQKRKEAEAIVSMNRHKQYALWLKNNLLVGKTSPVGNSTSTPFSNKGVVKLKASFWALKARVCKPYPKG